MDRSIEFFGQRAIDRPLALNPVQALERRRHDLDPEMAFAALWRPCMASVEMGLVDDRQSRRREGGLEL